MSYSRSIVTYGSFALIPALLALSAACGGPVKDNKSLNDLDETQAQTLCEDLKSAGSCTYKSDGSEVSVDAPEDCNKYSERVTNVDKEKCKDVTAGDARDCHNSCSDNKEACNAYTECLSTGSTSSDGSSE